MEEKKKKNSSNSDGSRNLGSEEEGKIYAEYKTPAERLKYLRKKISGKDKEQYNVIIDKFNHFFDIAEERVEAYIRGGKAIKSQFQKWLEEEGIENVEELETERLEKAYNYFTEDYIKEYEEFFTDEDKKEFDYNQSEENEEDEEDEEY